MTLVSVGYRFSVRLPAPPEVAYRWATDYRPDDPARMGEEGRRTVVRLAPDAVLLTDTVRSGRAKTVKSRLVRLMPERWAWTNTHVAGPYKHSQFFYEIVPAGRGRSRLKFTGLQLESWRGRPSARAVAARAREVRRHDAAAWQHLVRAMARDLGATRRSGRRRASRTADRRRTRSRR